MTSLRSRLTAAVMIPLLALAVAFGFIICWMIWQSSNQTSDRILVGSVRLLTQAIDNEDDVRVKMMPRATLLLQRQAAPVTYFSVWDGEKLMAGDPRLPPPAQYNPLTREISTIYPAATFPKSYRNTLLANPYLTPDDGQEILQPTYFRQGHLDGKEVRIATEIRKLQHNGQAVVIQVADFMETRQYYQYNYFLRVFSVGMFILMIAAFLFYWAIAWGLTPFASLTAQIETARPEQQSNFRLFLEPEDPREAHSLARSFNALFARIDRAIDSLRQFTANASHQMRTPLAIVRVHLDILQRDGAKTAQGAAAIEDIGKAVISLEHLLVQLLTLARAEELGIDSGSQFDLAEVAADVIAARITQPEAETLDISFESKEDEPLFVLGHPALAAEMIANLFDNAVRYNRPGGSVVVRLYKIAKLACIEIQDDGPGIPQKDQQRVFERFYRAQNSSDKIGSGLGLPIVRALAERMGAEVQLRTPLYGVGLLARIQFQRPPAKQEETTAA